MKIIIDYKKLIDKVKKALETVAEKVIVFNLADVKNKDYQFVIDNYEVVGEDLAKKELTIKIYGKVMKACNLQGEEPTSGYFVFGVSSGDIEFDGVSINFKNKVEILNDFTKITYGYGSLQVIDFSGLVVLEMVVDDAEYILNKKIKEFDITETEI